MEFWKKYLLSTAARFSPPDEGGGDSGAGGDAGAAAAQDGGADTGAGQVEAEQSDAGGNEAGDADGGGADDDEDPLAGLSPEQRAKVERRMQKEVQKEVGWRDRQIDRLHRKTREAQEDNKTLTTIAARQGGAAGDPPAAAQLTQEQIRTEAARLAAQEKYNEGLIETDDKGRQYYDSEWKGATDKLAKLGGVSPDDMQAILATDNPAVVLYSLSDPEEYERVMALSGAKRSNAFVKLGLKAPPKKKGGAVKEELRPSGAPPPPRVIGGARGVAAQSVDLYNDKVDDDAWYAERNKARRKKFSDAV